MKPFLRKAMLAVSAPCVAVVLLELALRVAGFPHGYFAFFFPPREGQYPKNAEMRMTWGPIPYVIRSNNLGLRGPNVLPEKKQGAFRVATVGDSITAGFFVDNEHTWQHYLHEFLNGGSASRFEIVNCAREGGSIDAALSQLTKYALPLDPDIVILTFVSNDIFEILGRSEEELLQRRADIRMDLRGSVQRFLLTKTALGEAIYDGYLFLRFPSYRAKRSIMKRPVAERYNLRDGLDFKGNVEFFLNCFQRMDGLVLGDSFDERTLNAIEVYFAFLSRMSAACREKDSRLLLVYFPAYPQIYMEQPPMLINETLRTGCERLDVEFLDLTPGFRAAATRTVALHLAPIDFHPNPEGNRVFAQLVAEYLRSTENAEPLRGVKGKTFSETL